MDKLRVGLIGCGWMGERLAGKCSSLENAEIVAVFDHSQEAAKKLADEFGARTCASQCELLASGVDGVIVAVPNDLHAPIVIKAVGEGKHVFCEKPMALSVADCDAMIQAAERAGVKLMVGQVLRLMEPFRHSKQIVASGELGAPFAMSVTRLAPIDALTGGWRIHKKHTGGLLFEIHIHELDFMRYVLGEAKSIYASTGHFTKSPVDYEDVAFVQVRYESGAIGVLHCGVSASLGGHEIMIQCEDGTLVNSGFNSAVRYKRFDGDEISVEPVVEEDPYRQEVRSWVDAITKGTEMVFTGGDGRSAVELVEAAYLSSETGDVVQLPLPD